MYDYTYVHVYTIQYSTCMDMYDYMYVHVFTIHTQYMCMYMYVHMHAVPASISGYHLSETFTTVHVSSYSSDYGVILK